MERVKPEIHNAVKERLKPLIEEAGNVTAFARSIGVSRDAVNNWLFDKSDLRLNDLVKISQKYGVSVDYLLGLAESPTREGTQQAAEEYTGLSSEAVEMLSSLKKDCLKPLLEVLSTAIASPIFVWRFLTALSNWTVLSKKTNAEINMTTEQKITVGELNIMGVPVLLPEDAAGYYASQAEKMLAYYMDSKNPQNSPETKELYRNIEFDCLKKILEV